MTLAATVAAAIALGAAPPACDPGLENCATASGTIVYVERVDPDGDGDAHFVLASDDSISLPGISVIDVERELRPHPLPGPGDLVAAAGPVYRGAPTVSSRSRPRRWRRFGPIGGLDPDRSGCTVAS